MHTKTKRATSSTKDIALFLYKPSATLQQVPESYLHPHLKVDDATILM